MNMDDVRVLIRETGFLQQLTTVISNINHISNIL